MKSLRLTKEMRNKILVNIMDQYDSKNPCPEAKTPGMLKEALKDALRELYLKEAEKVEKLASAAGVEKYLRKTDHFFVYVGGEWFDRVWLKSSMVNLNPDSAWVNLSEDMSNKVVQKHYVQYLKDLKGTKAAVDAHKKWDLERANFRDAAVNVLEGVKTTNQLLEVWPESEPFIPRGTLDPSNIKLSAVNIASLTNKL